MALDIRHCNEMELILQYHNDSYFNRTVDNILRGKSVYDWASEMAVSEIILRGYKTEPYHRVNFHNYLHKALSNRNHGSNPCSEIELPKESLSSPAKSVISMPSSKPVIIVGDANTGMLASSIKVSTDRIVLPIPEIDRKKINISTDSYKKIIKSVADEINSDWTTVLAQLNFVNHDLTQGEKEQLAKDIVEGIEGYGGQGDFEMCSSIEFLLVREDYLEKALLRYLKDSCEESLGSFNTNILESFLLSEVFKTVKSLHDSQNYSSVGHIIRGLGYEEELLNACLEETSPPKLLGEFYGVYDGESHQIVYKGLNYYFCRI